LDNNFSTFFVAPNIIKICHGRAKILKRTASISYIDAVLKSYLIGGM